MPKNIKLSLVVALGSAFASEAVAKDFPGLHRQDRTYCVFTGDWRDGTPFRYVAWDQCSRMRARSISLSDARSLAQGSERRAARLALIPSGANILELNNGHSRVLLYLNADGETAEVPFGD